MWKLLNTIWLGRTARLERQLETDNAAIIIEQKIREAERGHAVAKRGLATLLVKATAERKAIAILDTRISDLTDRTRQAVEAGRDQLAEDAAGLVADLENERRTRQQSLSTLEEKAARIRLAVEKTHRKLIDLRQGLLTAQSIVAERKTLAQMANASTSNCAILEGEAVLSRLLASDDPVVIGDTLDAIEDDLDGTSVTHALSDGGFGAPLKTRAADVLERIRASATPRPKPRKA